MADIIGLDGRSLNKSSEPEIVVDFFFPPEKANDSRIHALGHLVQAIIELSMRAEIGEFALRFKNDVVTKCITQPSGKADVRFIATGDSYYQEFMNAALPVMPAVEDQEEDEDDEPSS